MNVFVVCQYEIENGFFRSNLRRCFAHSKEEALQIMGILKKEFLKNNPVKKLPTGYAVNDGTTEFSYRYHDAKSDSIIEKGVYITHI